MKPYEKLESYRSILQEANVKCEYFSLSMTQGKSPVILIYIRSQTRVIVGLYECSLKNECVVSGNCHGMYNTHPRGMYNAFRRATSPRRIQNPKWVVKWQLFKNKVSILSLCKKIVECDTRKHV